MPTTYFGGLDEQSPMPAASTADWSTVNPPEVQAQAWQFEQQRRDAEREREMMSQYEGKNIEDTQKAVAAAMKFQAMRNYQNDVSSGKPPAEALMKWGPLMGLVRPAALPATDRVYNAGGVLYQRDASGKMVPQTPPKAAPDRMLSILEQERRSATARESAAREALAASQATTQQVIPGKTNRLFGLLSDIPGRTNQVPVFDSQKIAEAQAEYGAASNRLAAAQEAVKNYLKQSGVAPTNAPPPEIPAADRPQVQEVIRVTKDGKRAVFDANTKRFLRYAD